MRALRLLNGVILFFSMLLAVAPTPASAAFAFAAFQQQWQQGEALAPNFWGPLATAGAGQQEPYKEAQGGQRLVQYFDKGRMELTNGTVTNGLLASEMITGRIQIGADSFRGKAPPNTPIAGDPDGNSAPSYATFGGRAAPLLAPATSHLSAAVTTTVGADGAISTGRTRPDAGAAIAIFDSATNHNVPRVFADYRNRVGLTAIGLGISEPFWVTAKVAGKQRQVFVQVFERRVLTYTADNPDPFKVEMGNIGQHYYRWRYLNGPPIGQPAAEKGAAGTSAVSVRDDGTLLADGQPFFPFGFYLDQKIADANADIIPIAQAGFNTVHASSFTTDHPSYQAFLDNADSQGLRVIAEIDRDHLVPDVMAYRERPAILAYDVVDDCTSHTNAAPVLARTNAVHRADPNHPTFGACVGSGLTALGPTLDMAGTEVYPVGSDSVGVMIPAMQSLADGFGLPSKAILAIPQSYQTTRWPTPEEERVLTYEAVVMGAKGIIYYSYHDPVSIADGSPPLWAELQALAPEVLGLAPVFLEGAYTSVIRSQAISASTWQYAGKTYVIATNGDEHTAHPVDVPVAGTAAQTYTERYTSNFTLTNGHLTGVLPPAGVAVYVIS